MADENFDMLIDDEMLDGFDDFDTFDNPDDTTNERNPIVDVKAGALDELTDVGRNAEIARKIAKHSLPKGFSVAVDDVDDVAKDVSDIYSGIEKNFTKSITDVKRLINNSIGSAAFVPESIRDKILEATAPEDDYIKEGKDKPSEVDAAIMSSDTQIFAAWAERLLESNKEGVVVDGETKAKATKQASELLNEMRKINAYNVHVESPYQRKSMELQFRQYYALKDLVEGGRASTADSLKFLEAITRNTSLPDIQKTRLSEEYGQAVADRFSSSLGDSVYDYTSNFRSNLKTNATDKLNSFLETFRDSVGNVEALVDTLAGTDESSRNQLLGGEIASGATGWLSSVAVKRLNKIFAKNPKLLEMSNSLLYWRENFPGLFNGWLESNKDDNWIIEQISDLAPSFSGSDIGLTGDLAATATGAAPFDNVSHNTLNSVIPGYLSRILQQVTIANSGDPDTPLMTYGIKSRSFEDIDLSKERLRNELAGNAGANQYAIDNILSVLDGQKELSDEGRRELTKGLLNDSADGTTFNLSRLASAEYVNDDIVPLLRSLNERSTLERSEIDLRLAREQSTLARGFENADKVINRADNLGQRDTLDSLGLIDYAKDGTSSFSNEMLRDDLLNTLNLSKQYRDSEGKAIDGSVVLSDSAKERLETLNKKQAGRRQLTDEETEEFNKLRTLAGDVSSTVTSGIKDAGESIRTAGKRVMDEAVSGDMKAAIFKGFNKATRHASRFANGEALRNIDDARQNAFERLKEENLKPLDYNRALEKLDKLVADAKSEFGVGMEGLRDTGFSIPNYVDDIEISAVKPEDAERRQDTLDYMREATGTNDDGFVMSDSMISGFTDMLRVVGREQLANFKLDIMQDSIDGIRAMPVIMTGESKEVDSVAGLIDVNTAGFEQMLAGLATINESILASIVSSANGDPEAKRGILGSIGSLFKGAGQGLGSLTSSYFTGATSLTGALAGGLSKITGAFGKGVGKGLGLLGSKKKDVYVKGSRTPALLAKYISVGEYVDVNTGKTISSVDDISGEVKDSLGNTVLTAEEFAQGLSVIDPGSGSGALKLITSPIKTILALPTEMVKASIAIPKFVLGQINSLWNRPFDVYVAGETNPRLRASIFKNGGYRSRNTGKLISHPDDIDGEVEDLQGNLLLSNEDIMAGIYTRGGRKVGSSKLFSMVSGLLSGAYSLAKGTVGLGVGAIKKSVGLGLGVIGLGADAVVGTGKFLFGKKDKKKDESTGSGLSEEILGSIYGHMISVWPITRDGDDDASEFDEQMLLKQEEIIEAINAAAGRSGSGSDADGDGDRDGGWRDVFQRRKDKEVAAEEVKEEKVEKEKRSNVFDTILGMLGKFLPMIGGGITALGTALIGSKFAKGLMGGGGPDIGIDPDLPDRDGKKGKDPKAKGRGVKARGKLGKLSQGIKTGLSKLKGPAGKQAAKQGAKFAAKKVGKKLLIKGAVAGAGAIAAATGATVAGVALAPLIAIAGVAYGAFEIGAFFYDRRDTEQLERLRFLQYGVDDDYGIISDLRELESELEEYVVLGDKPTLNIPVKEVVEEYAEIFGVDLDSPQQVNDFTMWFVKRFTPVFLTHMTVLNKLDSSADLDDIDDDMDEELIVPFVKRVVNTAKHLDPAYAVTATPSPGDRILSNAAQIKEYANVLITQNGGKLESKAQPTMSPKIAEAVEKEQAAEGNSAPIPTPIQATRSIQNNLGVPTRRVRLDKMGSNIHTKPVMGDMSEYGQGVLITTSGEEEVKASSSGRVTRRRLDNKLGRVIEVTHEDGNVSQYSGLGSLSKDIKLGDQVDKNTVLGATGLISGKEGVRWIVKTPTRDGYRTVSPEQYLDDGREVERSPLLSDASGVTGTTRTNLTEAGASGIQSVNVNTSAASGELDREARLKERESRALVKAIAEPVDRQTERLRNEHQAKIDSASAHNQREKMIENQQTMIDSLEGILSSLSGRPKAKPNVTANRPRGVKTSSTPIDLSKRHQFT